jgi:hypothetical protein
MFSNRPAKTRSIPGDRPVQPVERPNDGQFAASSEAYHLRDRVQRKLLAEADGDVEFIAYPQMRQMIETLFNQVLAEEGICFMQEQYDHNS